MHRPGATIVFVVVFVAALSPPAAWAQTQASDCAVFEQLYTLSRQSYSWTTGRCCSTGPNIPGMLVDPPFFQCDSAGRILNAYVNGQHLAGAIPPLSNLTKLEYLDMSSNDLTGPIPPDLSGLQQLTSLDMSNNPRLSGNIPSLAGLTNLFTLSLSYCNLTGPLPSLQGLVRLSQLNLQGNRITGPLPPFDDTLSRLEKIDLSQNSISGPIPSLSGLKSLHYLDLSGNLLTGPLPNVSNLADLAYIILFGNQLDGNIDGLLPTTAPPSAGVRECDIVTTGNSGLFSCTGNFPLACSADITGVSQNYPQIVPRGASCPANATYTPRADPRTATPTANATPTVPSSVPQITSTAASASSQTNPSATVTVTTTTGSVTGTVGARGGGAATVVVGRDGPRSAAAVLVVLALSLVFLST
ncbi:hypothetical protein HDU93_003191 [Gonapodya sp. JEL0774]|nr:hypothetical protein HDU93_003191 [Gonapodya sp. JEL0774]